MQHAWFIFVFAFLLALMGMSFIPGLGQTGERGGFWRAPANATLKNLTEEKIARYRENSFETFPLNVRIFRAINNLRHPLLDHFFLLYRFLGTGWVMLPVVILLARFRRQLLTPMLIAFALESIVVSVLKSLFSQGRPAVVLDNVHLLLPLGNRSFPSGDTAMAFTIAGILCIGSPGRLRVLWLVLAALIGYERIYLGVHFPLDVVVGMLIGLLAAYVGYVYYRFQQRRQAAIKSNTQMEAAMPEPTTPATE